MPDITLTINQKSYTLKDLDPRTSLLDACRQHLKLTGSKKGCDHGQCGACTMIVNGRRINSCLTLAIMHQGDEITTIEGIGMPNELSDLQQAFIDHDAFQCGYCTPGQICSATALLDEIKQRWPSHVSTDLTEPELIDVAEIAERMSGNICRCSAYPNIINAIRQVIEQRQISDGAATDHSSNTDHSTNDTSENITQNNSQSTPNHPEMTTETAKSVSNAAQIWSPPASNVMRANSAVNHSQKRSDQSPNPSQSANATAVEKGVSL